MILTFTLAAFWPTILLVPTVAMIGLSIFFYLQTGSNAQRWADRVLFPVLAASACSAIVSLIVNLTLASLIAALMAGAVGAVWIVIMLLALSLVSPDRGAANRGREVGR